MNEKEMLDVLNKAFNDHPDGGEAKTFLHHYNLYNHLIDDIQDEERTDIETICRTHMMALNLYSSNFYRKYQDILYPVVRYIHHTWLDTVVMENMKEFWAREQANTLKSVGLEMVLTIIEILTSYEVRRSISVAVRKNSYDKQNTIYEII